MKPIFFTNSSKLRKWFERNYDKKKELLVGFHKAHTGKPSITWSESVDQALCFGWIDGIRKSLGETSYTIRFTPRKPGSIWSDINIKKVEELTKKGLMYAAGIEAFSKRDEEKSRVYSYERNNLQLDKNFVTQFRQNKKAWKFFQSQPPSYQKPVISWVMSAKQEETKLKRLATLIKDSEEGQRIKQLRRNTKKNR